MYQVPLGQSKIARSGRDLTLVAVSIMLPRAMEAAQALSVEGIEIEVIDPRTLRPMDSATIIESAKKTHRAMVVYEVVKTGGWGGEVVSCIVETEAFDFLDAPVRTLGGLDMPIPYNRNLEYHAVPQVENIIEEARRFDRGDC